MKKRLIFILMICILLSNINIAYAKDGIDFTIIEPDVKNYYEGQEIKYKINVDITGSIEDLANIFITYVLPAGVDYKDTYLEGVKEQDMALEIESTPNSEGRHNFINFKLRKMNVLNGKTNFNIVVEAKVNGNNTEGELFRHKFTVMYQKLDKNTKKLVDDFFESNLNSKITFTKNQAQDTKKPQDENPDIGKVDTNPVDNTDNSNYEQNEHIKNALKITAKTGTIYSYFMDTIEARTMPNSEVKIRIGEDTNYTVSDRNGYFQVEIPQGTQYNIYLNSKDESGVISDTTVLNYVDEQTIAKEDVDGVILSLSSFGYENEIATILKNFQINSNRIGVATGMYEGTNQDYFELFRSLYFSSREPHKANTVKHESFMNGYPDGTFVPDGSLTRAEAAAIFARIISNGEVPDKTSSFKDVDSGKWYTRYISYIEEAGIMKGYEDGTFKPQNKITRAEIATIVSRYRKLNQADIYEFKDLNYSHWAIEDVMKVVTADIMEGYPDGTFGPDKNVTRAEAATIINRTLKRTPDEEYLKSHNIVKFSDINKHWGYYQIIEATYDHECVFEKGIERYQ